MKPVRVGIIGLGTVGQGVIKVLRDNAEEITRRVGRAVMVTHASARDLSRQRDVDLTGIHLTTDSMSIAREADVDVVVEVMGGRSPARELILAAIARGKPVVTANKALIAGEGNRIFEAARAGNVAVAFEAAVGGGIPIIKAIREGLAGNRIDSVAGIINGTSNYILTQMAAQGADFADALQEAQRLGYAEADPTFDIEGVDAAHKLTILAAIAFGIPLSFDAVVTEGITRVSSQDIANAEQLGYRIKLLGIAKRNDAGVELRVQPTLVPQEAMLAKVDGVLNAVVVKGNAVGQVGFYGQGAGGEATASAVVADIVDLARAVNADGGFAVPALAFQPESVKALPLLTETESAFYLSLRAADEPGVLSKLTAILAAHEISVEAIVQREPQGGEDAKVALITSVIPESQLRVAMAEMQSLPFVRDGIARLRVEKFD